MSETMGDGDGSAAAFEAAVGLNPRNFVNSAHDIFDDIHHDAFQFARHEATTAGVLGAARADQKAAELDKGFTFISHVAMNVLNKRMTSWQRYCSRQIFTLPEGFVFPEDDNSCAKGSQKDRTSDTDLDLELNLLRKKLEDGNKETENLRREMWSLEKQATCKRELGSSIDEIQKLFEEKSVHKKYEDLVKAIPILQQKIISLSKKRTEAGNLVDRLRDNKRPALDKDFAARTEDIQEVVSTLQNK